MFVGIMWDFKVGLIMAVVYILFYPQFHLVSKFYLYFLILTILYMRLINFIVL